VINRLAWQLVDLSIVILVAAAVYEEFFLYLLGWLQSLLEMHKIIRRPPTTVHSILWETCVLPVWVKDSVVLQRYLVA
jgi:hypothetical protein